VGANIIPSREASSVAFCNNFSNLISATLAAKNVKQNDECRVQNQEKIMRTSNIERRTSNVEVKGVKKGSFPVLAAIAEASGSVKRT
jgi:hypothetical protein